MIHTLRGLLLLMAAVTLLGILAVGGIAIPRRPQRGRPPE